MTLPVNSAGSEFASMDDTDLLRLRAALHVEMKRRGLA
jgi:hypothetical protein